jgi:hypothetical protein
MASAVYRQYRYLVRSCCYPFPFCCLFIGVDCYQSPLLLSYHAFMTKGTIPVRIQYSGYTPYTGLARPPV